MVPAAVQRRLGIGPGSVVAWEEEGGERVVVRRVGSFSSLDLHEAVFSKPPKRRTVAQLKGGLKDHARRLAVADELSSLLETAHLVRSPANARRLPSAVRRALGRQR